MIKKNISPIKLIKYFKLINHNLIYNNKAINRYKKDNFQISADKADNLERLKKSIINIKNCNLNPKILVLLGSTAMNALIGNEVVISKMRGKWIEKKFGNCKTSVLITFHPAFLMRQPAQKKMAWIDLKMIRDKKI